MVYIECVTLFPFPSVWLHAGMWSPVCPCHLILTVVHQHDPTTHGTLCERAERPFQ